MSDGSSMSNRRITRPWFPICSTCTSRSQAPFCPYTLRMITDHAEGTFGCLRYCLGGDRPSQTGPLAMSLHPIQGARLEFQLNKGGMSRLAPRELTSPLHSLPPILHMRRRNPLPSCSKGSRGLSVQLRVIGIFTDTTISPSPW